jgi:surface carbohydrate biosynthesis protein (TIGR04326 family)
VLGYRTLLIWDSADPPPDNYDNKVLWQSYTITDQEKETSIPRLVEDNDDELRSKYLAFIFDLGEAKVADKKIVDHLVIRHDFSYWWMTLLVEKCNYSKSPQIDNIIKLMAFEKWFDNNNFTTIKIISANQELVESIRILTAYLGLLFEEETRLAEKCSGSFIRSVYDNLPDVLKSLISTSHYIFSRWNLSGVGVDRWKNSSATTLFVSYFFNLDSEESQKGKYKTGYWSKLPNVLENNSIESNWLHLYVKNDIVPTIPSAIKMVEDFNELSEGKQNHVFLDSFLSVSVVIQTMVSWLVVLSKYRKIKNVVKKESKHYWPLIEKDIRISMLGVTALHNLLFYYLFRSAMKMLPAQRRGMYLQENQGWEFGFVSTWREFKHEQLIGVPHSTVRYWDLRYFFDSRLYINNSGLALPLPDKVAVNGVEAKKQYIEGGYAEDKLVELEALRYLQLVEKDSSKKDFLYLDVEHINNVLVLGDYLQKYTKRQMNLLQDSYKMINVKVHFLVKPHPMCPIFSHDYPEINMTVTDQSIYELLDQCAVVYTSAVTSAAVDAYCAGKKVYTVLDAVTLNLSPLRGHKGVSFVTVPNELADMINAIGQIEVDNNQGFDYFYLDADLPRWRELLIDLDVVAVDETDIFLCDEFHELDACWSQ